MSINLPPKNNNYENLSFPPNTQSSKKRDIGLDITKGIAMLFIIAGHLGIDTINRFVFTFHVPLFFLLSGYFYTYKAGSLKNKIKRYFKPYIFTVVSLLFLGELKSLIYIFLGKASTEDLLSTAFQWLMAGLYGSGSKSQFLVWNVHAIGAIWFLLALIWSIIIMQTLQKVRLTLWIQEVIVITLFTIGYLSAFYTWFPFSIQAGLSALLFIFIGYTVKQRQFKIYDKKEAILLAAILWTWSLYYSYTNDFMSLVRSHFPDILPNILGACAASWLIICLCQNLSHKLPLASFFITFGRYSAVVLCFHLIELSFMPWKVVQLIIPYDSIALLVIFIGKIAFCYIAILIVQRNAFLRNIFSIR